MLNYNLKNLPTEEEVIKISIVIIGTRIILMQVCFYGNQ